MSTSTVPIAKADRRTKSLVRFAWGVLAYNVAVILWGGVVRATGSGAGCGEHWPLCNGTVMQHSPKVATLIEYSHRATSFVAVVAIVALLLWTYLRTTRKHLARVAVVTATVLVFNEALIGALLVLLGKTGHDESASRAVYLALHLTNTLLLVAALALTAHFLSRSARSGEGFMRGGIEFRSTGLASAGLIATLLVGVCGSLAALGDTLFPEHTLRAAFTADFSAKSDWLLRIRWAHPALAVIAGAFICWLIYKAARQGRNRRLAGLVIGLLCLQYGLGVADVMLLAPTWMQIVHLLGADLLWIALVVLTARICVVPVGYPAALPGES